LYPSAIWSIEQRDKIVYLTFDDGPVPEATLSILRILDEFQAKATFFVVGSNVLRHTEVVQNIVNSGHLVANHSFSHINGWKVSATDYLKDVADCAILLQEIGITNKLFRPPYGKITRAQAMAIKEKYIMVLWDVLSWDYAKNTRPVQGAAAMASVTKPGSIVLFHDNIKSYAKTSVMLKYYLQHLHAKGYSFESLPALQV
jgi:peptidoglycan/xylan/chitin deacetylase (PgdA/CDA1 family)